MLVHLATDIVTAVIILKLIVSLLIIVVWRKSRFSARVLGIAWVISLQVITLKRRDFVKSVV